MRRTYLTYGLFLLIILLFSACGDEPADDFIYAPTPFSNPLPDHFPPMRIPESNPMTEQGVNLGKKLFYDPIISAEGNFSCASCHRLSYAFSDTIPFSPDMDGVLQDMNTMPLFNTAFYQRYSWNGAIASIENDVLITISKLHGNWDQLLDELTEDDQYRRLFFEAFGRDTITVDQVEQSIAQFVRSLLSFNSRFDSIIAGTVSPTIEEMRGYELFFTEEGDCFHCHIDPLFTNTGFHNNALDNVENMHPGFSLVTGSDMDKGKFKVPSLRNLYFTAPYMHDGRFKTIRDVINFYSEGLQASPYADSNMKNVHKGGIQLSEEDKEALEAFLFTLTDFSLVNNPDYANE
jgi:cytochrome c peroxidase